MKIKFIGVFVVVSCFLAVAAFAAAQYNGFGKIRLTVTGTAALPTLAIGPWSDSNNGINYVSTDRVQVITGGTSRIDVQNSGVAITTVNVSAVVKLTPTTSPNTTVSGNMFVSSVNGNAWIMLGGIWRKLN